MLLRTSLSAVLGVLFAAPAHAGEEAKPASASPTEQELFERRILPADIISHTADAWTPAIRECWLKHAPPAARATGILRVEIVVAPEGRVSRRWLDLAGRSNRARDRCVFRALDKWQFPYRSSYTHAIVPFAFLRAKARSAGPIHSCASTRGCRRPRR